MQLFRVVYTFVWQKQINMNQNETNKEKGIKKTDPIFLTESEVAYKLRITKGSLRNLRKRGEIQFFRVGKKIRYPLNAIDNLMNNAK